MSCDDDLHVHVHNGYVCVLLVFCPGFHCCWHQSVPSVFALPFEHRVTADVCLLTCDVYPLTVNVWSLAVDVCLPMVDVCLLTVDVCPLNMY